MPTKEKVAPNRWGIAAAGVAMQLILGTVYAWSVFKNPFMAQHGWSGENVGLAFTLVILFIGLAAAFGGKFVDKAGARKVATIAAILFGAGTILTGVADAAGSLALLYIGYGVIGGIGNGLGYITPIAVLVRWFPDKRGLITGLAVMGFGFGASIMGQIAPFMIPKTSMVDGALKIVDPGLGLATTFYIFGAAFLVILLIAAQYLNNPPADWVAPAAAQSKVAAASATTPVDLKGALGMNQFYLLWLVLFINITAGIALISNLAVMAQENCGVTAIAAGTVIFIASVFNGLGRIFWASLSDKLGRKNVFMLILGTQVPLFFILPGVSSIVVFTVMVCYILACYGGGFATMPAYAADTFTAKFIGNIYGKILLAWAAAGVVGPMLMEFIKKSSGSFTTAIYVAGGMLVVGFVINLLYRKPEKA
ncbi:MAG: OFA family MFS transporter [Vicinamibacteria bacterium]|nr:OFA family MFS transporter [Vicinamibacteria bacterium]